MLTSIGRILFGGLGSFITSACAKSVTPLISPAVNKFTSSLLPVSSIFAIRTYKTITEMALYGPFRKKRAPNKHMDGRPFMKGFVLKTLIRKPKKPNSANRRCVKVRLSNGREVIAYVPGEGHNLQEHNIVLVRGGRCQDLIGVKHKIVRGKFDYRGTGIDTPARVSGLSGYQAAEGFFGSLFMLGPFLPLAFVAPSLFLLLMDCGVRLWCMLSEVLLNGVLRIQVRLFGDSFVFPAFSSFENADTDCNAEGGDFSSGTSSILILNHRTRLDWIFALSLGRYARHLKIVLKQDLANLPGVGWAMQLDSFIFLKRKIALDLARIQQAVKYLLKLQGSAHVLMFPEGTDLSACGLTRSDAYAEKMGLPLYRYTLHPRTTGFESFVRALGSNLGYVYDVTVAYPYAITESELKMALGDCPQEVHFHVRRWAANQLSPLTDKPAVTRDDSSDVSSTPSPLAKWLQDRWAEKEKMLKDFYASPPDERRFPSPELVREDAMIPNGQDDNWSPGACVVLAYWIVFLFFSLFIVWRYWLIRIYVIAMTSFFIYRCGHSDGLSGWVADLAGVSLTADPLPTPASPQTSESAK
nr:lysocardiolipin acyltransferase 1 [Hymenolepis microstoma]